jgi:hypothetical protein
MSINILTNAEDFDVIVLAGTTSPGLVTITGADREIEWDVKTAPGQKGSTTTMKGDKPAEPVASFYLATEEDFDAWDNFDELIRSTVSGTKPKALDIYHPDLAKNGITSVVMKKIGSPVYDKKGGATITVNFLEYRPPKPAGGTPKGSSTSASSAKKKDPDQDALDELAKLTKQYNNTPWG